MKKIRQTPVGSTPPKCGGWVPLIADPSEGWSPTLIDDPTLVIAGIRRTRDERGNSRTFYKQMVCQKELRRLRRKVARVIERDKKEEREARMLRFMLRNL